jgi:ferric-dicitrate binding protein FerR (iron transport regulator)
LEKTPDHIDELIAGYLVGEATPDQVLFIEQWTKESEENLRYLGQLKLIFDNAAKVTKTENFETDAAWQKVRAKIHLKKEGRTIPFSPSGHGYRFVLKIAAGIVMLILAGVFTLQYFKSQTTESISVLADKNVATDTLPDGSGVFLNRQTRIEYEFNKKKNTHTARLVGEAYFNINHDDDKTFIVEAGGVFIKDIGTSFNVKAYPDSATIEVVVEEGEVMFYAKDSPGVYLKANGKGIYNKKTKIFTVAEPEPNVTAYKTKFFSFSDNDLATVIKTINEVYSGKIQIDNRLSSCRLTVSFNNESIDEIASVIAETLGLTVKKSGNLITLEGSGCDDRPQP